MEDVRDLHHALLEPPQPRLWFDERPCQLLGQFVVPWPMQRGRGKREDYEYTCQGTAVILLAYDLDHGRRFLEVRQRRTKADYAECMRRLAQEHYADGPRIRLVQGSLNTHSCRVSV